MKRSLAIIMICIAVAFVAGLSAYVPEAQKQFESNKGELHPPKVISTPSEGSKDHTYILDDGTRVVLAKACSITYRGLPEGVSSNNSGYYFAGIGINTLKDPSVSFGFIGWYNAEVGGERLTSIPPTSSDDITLWARYDPFTLHHMLHTAA